MRISVKTKIWLTILSVVLMFSLFILYYFPVQQGKLLLRNYNTEVQNLANTVSLGVRIALTEQNFEGVQTAMEFVKDDKRLEFIAMIQEDTVWQQDNKTYALKQSVFKTFPEKVHVTPDITSNDTLIVKSSPFRTSIMSGKILLAFTTKEIITAKKRITNISLIVSAAVFLIGILISFLLAKSISLPILALRNAALKVGEGDLTQHVESNTGDEIEELGKAFNKMVDDLAKTRKQLKDTNTTLASANETLHKTLNELKTTQAQLIQNEKMASLGELTAGIAHEIQNPLNFVTNFAEVNAELIDEMRHELTAGNVNEAIDISNNISSNIEKIIHHGKRADNIVKGMLQHSRTSTGQKELTDINGLADEYLRLSYHGLRAKDKSFNATMKTQFDETIGRISIAPQDMGRVLLNLFNNAFYAVSEKKKSGAKNYEPIVSVSTIKNAVENYIEIIVRDNGTGIPQKVIDKIFQPFFTTKPTGEGTGLGLSLSYDTIKAHGGTLKVDTVENEYAQFIIQLPLDNV